MFISCVSKVKTLLRAAYRTSKGMKPVKIQSWSILCLFIDSCILWRLVASTGESIKGATEFRYRWVFNCGRVTQAPKVQKSRSLPIAPGCLGCSGFLQRFPERHFILASWLRDWLIWSFLSWPWAQSIQKAEPCQIKWYESKTGQYVRWVRCALCLLSGIQTSHSLGEASGMGLSCWCWTGLLSWARHLFCWH